MTLSRARKRRAFLIRNKPHWVVTINDTAVIIDALERLILVETKGANNGKDDKKKN